jgi:hypothetical protein
VAIVSDAGRTEAAAVRLYKSVRPGTVPVDAIAGALAAADGWDREHGIVRIDTRDEALRDLLLRAVLPAVDEIMHRGSDWKNVKYAAAVTDRVVAALAAVGAQGEAQ